jgi:signal transduction histidine kinase
MRKTKPSNKKRSAAAVKPKTTSARKVIKNKAGLDVSPKLRDHLEVLEKLNQGLRHYINEMSTVFRFIGTVSGLHAADKIIQLLFDVLKELTDYHAAAIYLHSSPENPGEAVLKHDVNGVEILDFRRRLDIDDHIYQWIFHRGHPVIIPEKNGNRPDSAPTGWSFMIAPLTTAGERVGWIELVFSRPQGAFTQQTFSMLNVLLKHAAVILVNERVYEKERQTARKYRELDLLKKDVVNTTSHEIKTPLTIIQGSSILLERDPSLSEEERHELLQKIIFQTQRINQIVTELFETAQLEENEAPLCMEKIWLDELTRQVLRELVINPTRHPITIDVDPERPPIRADRSGIFKALRNLIENAVKYSPEGGEIAIRIRREGAEVLWEIQDHGIGIAREDQARIFTKFFRVGENTTRKVGGMGFGLYLVKKNIEINQGKIVVVSTLGQGSTFQLRFPACLT